MLSEDEIKVLEKGLDFAPVQNKVNEPELRKDFDEFCRQMRIKWHFRNEPSEKFSTIPAFRSKSSWKPTTGHPNLEVFLSSVEKELLEDKGTSLRYSNLSTEEWEAIRSLADDRSIVIKKADKGSAVVVWERNDYIKEAEKQLGDKSVYQKVNFKEKLLCELVDKSNSSFKELKRMGCISDKILKCFTYEFNLGKFYLLAKIQKSSENVPGRPIISNCGAPTEKASEFLDFHQKSIMQNGTSYIKDSNDFKSKIKNIDIPNDALLVTADVVGLYPGIPHEAGLSALKEALNKRTCKEIPTENLIKMAEFVLKNNFFEFDTNVYQQISGTAIETKFAPPYACIFMDQLEIKFLENQNLKSLVWFRYLDDIFFIWTHSEENLRNVMTEFNLFSNDINFTYEYKKDTISFLDLKVISSNDKLITSLYSKHTGCHQYESCHPKHTKRSIVYSKALRIKRVCSEESDFNGHSLTLRPWFLKRGYPEKNINTEMSKVKFNVDNKRSNNSKKKEVSFVVTFHPKRKVLRNIINKHLYLLYMNDEVKRVFTAKPMVSFRSSSKICSYLVRAKLYPIERTVGSFRCGSKRCEVCKYITETNTFTSSGHRRNI